MTEQEITEKTLTDAAMEKWGHGMKEMPRFVMAVQVHNGAGFRYSRKIDAIVLDTWPSKGITLHGLEMKISKSDFRRELKNPQKHREFEPYLDRFSIVAAPGVVSLDVLPAKWGAYVLKDDGTLHTLRAPLPLHDDPKPHVSRGIFAAFCRALVTRSLSDEAIKAAYDRGLALGKERAEGTINGFKKQAEEAQEAIDEFEEKSGVGVRSYNAGQIGEAVKVVMGGGLKRRLGYRQDIRSLGEGMIKLADELDRLDEAFGEDT